LWVILDLAGSILFRWRSEEWVLHTRHSSWVIQTVEGCASCTVHCAIGVKWYFFIFLFFYFSSYFVFLSEAPHKMQPCVTNNIDKLWAELCNRTEVVFVCSCKWLFKSTVIMVTCRWCITTSRRTCHSTNNSYPPCLKWLELQELNFTVNHTIHTPKHCGKEVYYTKVDGS
jgi:hypothetical protein